MNGRSLHYSTPTPKSREHQSAREAYSETDILMGLIGGRAVVLKPEYLFVTSRPHEVVANELKQAKESFYWEEYCKLH